jgi:CheY-like chemotaxis protein
MSRRPQIVLTDLVMPSLSGMDVLERIMEFDSSIEVVLDNGPLLDRIRRRSDQEAGQPLFDQTDIPRGPNPPTLGTHYSAWDSWFPVPLFPATWLTQPVSGFSLGLSLLF